MKAKEMKEQIQKIWKDHKSTIIAVVELTGGIVIGYRICKHRYDNLPIVLNERVAAVLNDAQLRYGGAKKNTTIFTAGMSCELKPGDLGKLGELMMNAKSCPADGSEIYTHFIAIGPSDK